MKVNEIEKTLKVDIVEYIEIIDRLDDAILRIREISDDNENETEIENILIPSYLIMVISGHA